MDLDHRSAVRGHDQLCQRQQVAGVLDVERHVLLKDALELVVVGSDLARRQLLPHLAQELLLAGRAHEVVVVVAVADVRERV